MRGQERGLGVDTATVPAQHAHPTFPADKKKIKERRLSSSLSGVSMIPMGVEAEMVKTRKEKKCVEPLERGPTGREFEGVSQSAMSRR